MCALNDNTCGSSTSHDHTQDSNTEAKLSDISAALAIPLERNCSCSLTVQRHFFSCLGAQDSQTAVYLAEVSYTALPGVDLTSLLTTWVGSTPPITVASTQLQVDTTCPVVIDSLEPDNCAPRMSTPSVSADTTVYLILCVLIALFVVSISTHSLTLVLLLVICRRLRKLDR